jgi:hypothetical protein
LQAINEDDDILMAMARELVTEKGIGERADQVWANLQKKQEEVFSVRSSETEASTAELVQDLGLTESETAIAPASHLPALATPLESIPRRTSRRQGSLEGQLTLF